MTPSRAVRAPLRVAVLGGHSLSRDALGALIGGQPDMQALSASDLDDLVRGHADPDVVVLDITDAGNEDSVDMIELMRRQWPESRILVLVAQCEAEQARRFVLAGAAGVFGKHEPGSQLISALRKVHAGEAWLGRTSMSQLIAEFAAGQPGRAAGPQRERIESLTARELAVVHLVSHGFSNKAIAAQLGISDNTVRHHLTSVFAKLEVPDRLALAVFALRNHVETTTRKS